MRSSDMTAAGTVAYAICRHCAAVFPAERRCPQCDHDLAAAAAIAAATATAVEPAALRRAHAERVPARPRLLLPLIGVAALMLGLGIGLAWMVVHRTPVSGAATMSSTDGAAR